MDNPKRCQTCWCRMDNPRVARHQSTIHRLAQRGQQTNADRGWCLTDRIDTLWRGWCLTDRIDTLWRGWCLTDRIDTLWRGWCLTDRIDTLWRGWCLTDRIDTLWRHIHEIVLLTSIIHSWADHWNTQQTNQQWHSSSPFETGKAA